MWIVKGVLFACLLVWASISDIRKREIPDVLPAGIFFIGLIHVSLLPALLGLFATGLPFFTAAILTRGKIGGGDIKLMAACGFVLGVSGGILQTILGLSLALIGWLFQSVTTGFKLCRNTAMPLAPFLAVGGIIAFWIIHRI
ncbi:A24 family peptidase [Paenibacillus sp. MSJ-34]|uniref:prepilin peptidase n=1 Tax=Paenibacillus sp. MSJ-34 TaxID=2841529 RepID=UPI001C11EB33|nr:A24 family peptidase [Paenibacillus sp. MSJ-34]MBU5445240.1 A24 family peptidase [Paenibacillus sp. MSJ-34]